MLIPETRRAVLEASLEMIHGGLVQGTAGNISMRDAATGLVAITPTTVPYESLKPEDITVVDVNGKILEGTYKPSSETPMHTAILRARADVNAVVHTHSIYATTFSVLNRELPVVIIGIASLAPAPVVPFEMPGSEELAARVVAALGEEGTAVMLQNHGSLVVGSKLDKTLASAFYLEEGARVALLALQAGGLNPIDEHNVMKLKERNRRRAAAAV